MNTTPWLPTREQERRLSDPVQAAENAGLAVLLPALAESFAAALESIPGMDAALREALTDDDIRILWESMGAEVQAEAVTHWAGEVEREELEGEDADLDGVIEAWATSNDERIRALRDSVSSLTIEALEAAEAEGRGSESLAWEMETRGLPATNGRLGGRGRVIAQDQLGTLGSEIAQRQQEASRIRALIWNTQGDDRVRDAHEALAGRRFSWSNLPSEGAPGSPVGCRCWAAGVTTIF